MTLDEALHQACAAVGIEPPRGRLDMRRWVACNVIGKGSAGKGDGRVICDEQRATAVNWVTGEKATVWLAGKESITPADRARYAREVGEAERKAKARAAEAAEIASRLIKQAVPGSHPYMIRKGFPDERPLVIDADQVRRIAGGYMVSENGASAIIIPARAGQNITSAQLIWEDGTKQFLFGGAMRGATHRVATGRDTWLAEGYATSLSLRAALRGLNRRDTVLMCFSAANIATVAATIRGHCYVAADHDKPQPQFGGIGTGEHYARKSGRPYIMPAEPGDVNDLHQAAGIFAVQRLVTQMMRKVA